MGLLCFFARRRIIRVMPPNDLPFEQFFAEKIKERGMSLKKLSEMTGIAPSHIENLLRGDYENMPSAPYFHGYLIHLGAVLDFDGEEWWAKLKKEGVIKNSGELDTLPRNRFIKQAPPKYLWWIGAGVIVLIYLAFQAPRIFGKPTLTVISPDANPYVTASSTFTLAGTVAAPTRSTSWARTAARNRSSSPRTARGKRTSCSASAQTRSRSSAKKFLGGANDRHGADILPAGGRHGADVDGQLNDNRLRPERRHAKYLHRLRNPRSLTYF